MRSHVCFRIDTANTQYGYRTPENGKVIRVKVIVQICFRFPFTYEQGRILILCVEIKIERAATFGSLHRIEQRADGLKELGPLLRLHRYPGGIHYHLGHFKRHVY